MAIHKTCDGLKRRDFLKAGVLGGSAFTLANYLQFASAGDVAAAAKCKSAIFISLPGGPSHMDMFDLKPNAPAEYRGEFNPIKTNVSGIEISEHLPKLAACMDKFVILRGVTHTLALTIWVPSTSTAATGRSRRWSSPATAPWSRRKRAAPAICPRSSPFPTASSGRAIWACSTRR